MTNVGYDLDTSGGLMPLIRALIKPPDDDLNATKPKKTQHPYYKRPGKGHNHDSCDACGEGGDLICCDRCPASFHLGCYDPPLDENDIPAGLWLCRECKSSDDKPSSSRSSRAQSPADSKSDTEKKTRSLRNNRTASGSKKKTKEDLETEAIKKEEVELTPMEILVNAAKVMNPKQFELPREMRVPCLFPGTEKEGSKNGGPSVVTVDSAGCVPLPAKSCYVCLGTCKQAPLLQCDYCPLLFHQDCLDPPLTALPTGRWMCPNHVEQYIDWKLVNSISATERVALWDKFSAPVDQHAIKIDFIRRARNRHPSFRVKVPRGVRGRVVVPAMVRAHYRRPPPLLPSRREHVRCSAALKRLKASGEYESSSSEEEERRPKHKICVNVTCPQYGGGACPLARGRASPAVADAADTGRHADTADTAHAADTGRQADAADDQLKEEKADSQSDKSEESSSTDMSDLEEYGRAVKKRRMERARGRLERAERGQGDRGERGDVLRLRAVGGLDELLAAVQLQLDKLDERLVRLLAWQRLQQIAAGEACAGRWRGGAGGAGGSAWGARAAAALRGAERAQLARLGVRRLPLPSELLAAADRERIAALVWGPPPPAPPQPAALPPHPARDLADALVRATLCEVFPPTRSGGSAALGRAHPMRLAALSIGAHSGCDVVLSTACRRVSRLHALLFYDEVTGHYELINYSEWGTVVNGVMYACDARACGDSHKSQEPHKSDKPDEADAQQALRDALRPCLPPQPPPLKIKGPVTEGGGADVQWCGCSSRDAAGLRAAWEGSALVAHGALLQFGCRSYVFSVTQPPPHSPRSPRSPRSTHSPLSRRSPDSLSEDAE